MAQGSEQISLRWIEGLKRACRECGSPMKNLQRDVGQIHRNADDTGWIRCMNCRPGRVR